MIQVAILMPVFNEGNYIVEAVKSVLDFSYPEGFVVELIVVDDFSTDSTYALLEVLQRDYKSKLTVLKNKSKGKNHAINLAAAKSKFDFVCFMGGDDIFVPATLMLRVRILQENIAKNAAQSKYVASACKIRTFSKELRFDGILIPKKHSVGAISGGSLLMPSALAQTIFPLPVDVPNEDTWMSLHLRYRGIKVFHIGEIGLLYRIHEHNSHKRGVPFEEFQRSMWDRGRVILSFYAQYSKDITSEKERQLLTELVAECLKSLGAIWSIIFLPRLNLKEKLKALTYSSPVAYYVKQKFYKYLAGR